MAGTTELLRGFDREMQQIQAGLLGLMLLLPHSAAGSEIERETVQAPAEQATGGVESPADPVESESESSEQTAEGATEVAHDAMRDPLIGRIVHERRVIDRPRFSLLTGGKIQVQYYNADSDDPDNEDEWLLRRVRPFAMGHFATNWRWKFELEISSQLTALEFDTNDLDIRDAFVRYVGFEHEGRRLTFGNQKPPFSRDFMNPAASAFFPEKTFAGSTRAGIPDRSLGVHLRSPSRSDKVVFWASVAAASHNQDARSVRFESPVGASSEINTGRLAAARIDVQPTGALRLRREWFYDLSLAGYHWGNDGSRNTFTEDGIALDPEKADLDRARGVELSGRLRAGGFALVAQYNLVRAETVVDDFTGGLYIGGTSDLESSAAQLAYRMPWDWLQLVGAFTRLDSDGYATPWEESIAGLNLDLDRFFGRIQLAHWWISSRFGIPGEDYRELRLQVQYVW